MISGCYSREPEKTGMEGQSMPSFKILLADSSTYLDTKYIAKGKPTVLFYFGPHCPYSKAQIEEIIEDIDLLKNINFYVFTNWPFADMKKFNDTYKLNLFPNIKVGVDVNNFFADHFETPGVPYTAVYNSDKKLNSVFVGNVFGKQIKKAAEN